MGIFYSEGKYSMRVDGAALGKTQGGSPQIEIYFTVLGEYSETDGQLHECPQKQRTAYLTLTDKTIGAAAEPGWVIETLRTLGFAGKSFGDLGSVVGYVGDGLCKHEEYAGKVSEKWSFFSGQRGPKEVYTDVGGLDCKYSDVLRALSGGSSAARPAAASARTSAKSPAPPRSRTGGKPIEYDEPAEARPAQADDIPF